MYYTRLSRFGNKYRIVYLFRTLKEHGNGGDRHSCSDLEEPRTKLDNNLCRARSAIREIALCNNWTWFGTFTLSDVNGDRYDLKKFIREFGVWIGNYNRKFGTKLRYLIIPEQHKNGAWHLHGLLDGVADNSLVVNQYGYMDMPYYANRFGFISLSRIKDPERVASYITKYVTKQTGDNIELGYHSYYCSRGLNRAQLLAEFTCSGNPVQDNKVWCNEYCGIEWVEADDLEKRLIEITARKAPVLCDDSIERLFHVEQCTVKKQQGS